MRHDKGFTLIELMVVVMIIAIIAAFAVPNFLRYGLRSRRSDGQAMLMRVANAQEQYYATYNSYGSLSALGYTTAASQLSEKGYYQLSISPSSPTSTFTASAAPVAGGPQSKDDCGTLTINNTGTKSQSGSTTNGTCW